MAKELIGGRPDFVSTSMWAPLGHAAPEGSGCFAVSGRWPFNSGCPHATWLQVGVLVTGSSRAGGAPDWRFAFAPARSALIEDSWDAMGLRGTGSHHLSLPGVRVPAEHLAAPFFEPARHDGPLWRIPLVTLATMFLAAVPLGVARRALDEFAAVATSKVRGRAAQSIGYEADAQSQLALAEGALASARCFLFDAIARIWATACRGDEPDLGQRALVTLAANHAVRAATEAVDRGVPAGRRGCRLHAPSAAALLQGHPRGRPAHLVQRRPRPGLRQSPPRHRPADLADLTFPYHAVVTIHLASDGPQTLHAALGDADSYATRLFDYEHSGRDQVAWVVDRLRRDPATRSAAITIFQPHTDTSYVPCVSLLDFWLPDGAVELIAYAHSIDFGAKGYGNLVELAALQQHVADQLGRPAARPGGC